jgi:hypothetical protein
MTALYTYDLSIFRKKKNMFYYIIGALMTDGCIHVIPPSNYKRASLSSKDIDWLQLITDKISPNRPIILEPHKNKGIYWINNTDICNILIKNNCGPRKTLTLQPPPYIPKKYLPDFIRGCWDGDGSLSFTNRFRKDRGVYELCRRAKITSGSYDFIKYIFDYLKGNNINCTIQITKPKSALLKSENRIITSKHDCYDIHLSSGFDVYNFCKLIYFDNSCLVMPRKQNIANAIIKDWEERCADASNHCRKSK